jgi:hypothetical protein
MLDATFESIIWRGEVLCYFLRAAASAERTQFVTPDEQNLQLGFIVYPAGEAVARHVHRPIERRVVGTTEVLLVKTGRCYLDLYSESRELVATREMKTGDIAMLISGGHGLRMLEDTVLLEIKQGPYTGINEKERF